MQYKIISRELKKQLLLYHNNKETKIISKGKMTIYRTIRKKLNTNSEIPAIVGENGEILTNDNAKCENFAKEFQKSFLPKEYKKIYSENSTDMLKDINFDVISQMLKKLPDKNSTSPDGIPYFLLKKCADSLAPVLTEIFRSILDGGQIPSLWRKSYIIPIHKKGEKSDLKNYRPIFLTCTLCRVFEKIVVAELVPF